MNGPSPEFIEKIIPWCFLIIFSITLDFICQKRHKKLQTIPNDQTHHKETRDSETQQGETKSKEIALEPEDVQEVGWRDYSRR